MAAPTNQDVAPEVDVALNDPPRFFGDTPHVSGEIGDAWTAAWQGFADRLPR